MSYFWGTPENAGPSMWHVGKFWDREPRILRPKNRSAPPSFIDPWIRNPRRMNVGDVKRVCEFFRSYYGGADWYLQVEEDRIRSLLQDPNVIGLVSTTKNGEFIATIFARPLVQPGSVILIGSGIEEQAFMVEGLCVHKDWRGKHLAGWLISWVDYIINQTKAYPVLWTREYMARIHGSDVSFDTYGYFDISNTPSHPTSPSTHIVTPVDRSEFEELWNVSVQRWSKDSRIVVTKPYASSNYQVWSIGEYYIVTIDTRRRTRNNNQIIWEVIWTGRRNPHGGLLVSEMVSREMLEALCFQHLRSGLLFLTEKHMNFDVGSLGNWKIQTSGHHATYIYNYMPPMFWKCRVALLHDDL